MARTAEMKLLELMVLKEDISPVVEYIGKKGNFQFVAKNGAKKSAAKNDSSKLDLKSFSEDADLFSELRSACIELQMDTSTVNLAECSCPTDRERTEAARVIESFRDLN